MEVINYFVVPGLKRELMLNEDVPMRIRVKADRIVNIVCQHMEFNKARLNKTKAFKCKNDVVVVRSIIWFLVRQEIPKEEMSLRQIGAMFGYDHSSVLHSIGRVKNNDDLKRIKQIYFK